jgi:hypothetical protein
MRLVVTSRLEIVIKGTMNYILRTLLSFALVAGLAASSSASGLVQVSMRGTVYAEAGAMIEFSVSSGSSEMEFKGMVGEGTRVGDLAALFERRLTSNGFRVTVGKDASGQGPVSLFIEQVETIHVRFCAGIHGTITSSEEMPLELKALPPRAKSDYGGGSLRAFFPLTDPETDQYEIHTVDVDLPTRMGTATGVADKLEQAATRLGIASTRPDKESWSVPGAPSLSVALYADSDWGVELVLEPLVKRR